MTLRTKKPNRTDLTEHRLRLEQKYPENKADLDTIEKRLEMFDKDMATYAYDIPEAERGYRNIPDRLEKAIRSKNSAYIAERDRATSLKKDYEERLVTETKSAQDANQKLTQARGEVSSEIQKYEGRAQTHQLGKGIAESVLCSKCFSIDSQQPERQKRNRWLDQKSRHDG